MNNVAKFSVLRYVPDIERQEFMNVGVVLHHPAQQLMKMRTTEAFSRVRVFDDEVDLSFFELILESIKSEFDSGSEEDPSPNELLDPDLLGELTARYTNQFQFSDISTLILKDFDTDLDDLFRTFVYFEVPKSNRIDENKVRSILSRTFRAHSVSKYLKTRPTVKGKSSS